MDEKYKATAQGSVISSIYFEKFSEYVAELYIDRFSDLTRKRQTNLLVCATLVILVRLSYLAPTTGNFGGLSFTFPNPTVLNVLGGLLCLYFLIIYITGFLQDMEASKSRENLIIMKIRALSMQMDLEGEVVKQLREQFLMVLERALHKRSINLIRESTEEFLKSKTIFDSDVIMGKFKTYRNLRNVIEIWFPIFLGVVSILMAFIKR